MISDSTTRVFESVIGRLVRDRAACCQCGGKPTVEVTQWGVSDDFFVRYTYRHGSKDDPRKKKPDFCSVRIPEELVRRLNGDVLDGLPWWELLHPFPRSVAHHGEVSAAARRERRERLGRRR
jgi:hypothetical protein